MKATGIVRRIDDLGRVVIPKEIRRTLRIRESEPLEIFTDRNGEIILKKYSPIGEMATCAQELADVMARVTGNLICICDQDQIVASAGPEARKYMNKTVSREVERLIMDRDVITGADRYHPITEEDEHSSQVIVPIISAGDAIGAVMILGNDKNEAFGEVELKLAMVVAEYLAKTMED
ncbi:MAG: stage V sporulation T C-terminal domain-containing protein [Lachnospiraceae bacterium]|nr:stage V sporulation T C-terminal domain-containing protein [Lachnospiraceae bacterium]